MEEGREGRSASGYKNHVAPLERAVWVVSEKLVYLPGSSFWFLSLVNHDGTMWKMCKVRRVGDSCAAWGLMGPMAQCVGSRRH